MGLFIGIIRKRYLMMQRATLQWQLTLITQAKRVATRAVNNLMQVGTDYEGDPLITKKLQAREYKLKLLDEKLDLQKEKIQEELDSIKAELDSVKGMIDSAIQESFSYKAA